MKKYFLDIVMFLLSLEVNVTMAKQHANEQNGK